MDIRGNIFFDGPAGRIEGLLKEAESDSRRAAIVCHPHPLFGGTMHNKVVYRIAKALNSQGFSVLRFNFRGAGRSEGSHDQGEGEQDDLRAAIELMTRKYEDAELWLAGFSFGASVMLRVACSEPRANGIIAAGLPLSKYDLAGRADCAKPKLFVQGSRDEFGSVKALEKFVEASSEPKHLVIVDGADHFFEGQLDKLEAAVSEFVSHYIT